jgi:hypothetical protein
MQRNPLPPPMIRQQLPQPSGGAAPEAIASCFVALDSAPASVPLDSLETLVPYLCARMQVYAAPVAR